MNGNFIILMALCTRSNGFSHLIQAGFSPVNELTLKIQEIMWQVRMCDWAGSLLEAIIVKWDCNIECMDKGKVNNVYASEEQKEREREREVKDREWRVRNCEEEEKRRKAGANLFVQSYYSSQQGIQVLTPVHELTVAWLFDRFSVNKQVVYIVELLDLFTVRGTYDLYWLLLMRTEWAECVEEINRSQVT